MNPRKYLGWGYFMDYQGEEIKVIFIDVFCLPLILFYLELLDQFLVFLWLV